MAKIGDLVMGVVVETKKANRNIKETRQEMRGLSKDVRMAANSLRMANRVLGAVGATVSAGAIVQGIRAISREIVQLNVTAEKLGETTENLSGMRWAALQTANVASNQFDVAMQRFRRRVQEAANGTGEARDVIRELGLDAGRLSMMPLSQQIDAVSDAMRGNIHESQQLRIAFKLLDSEGAPLVLMLRQGSEELQRFRDEAKRLGITIDEQGVAKVRQMQTSVDRMVASLKGLGNELAVTVAPAVEETSDLLSELIRLSRIWAREGPVQQGQQAANDLIDALGVRGMGRPTGEPSPLTQRIRERLNPRARALFGLDQQAPAPPTPDPFDVRGMFGAAGRGVSESFRTGGGMIRPEFLSHTLREAGNDFKLRVEQAGRAWDRQIEENRNRDRLAQRAHINEQVGLLMQVTDEIDRIMADQQRRRMDFANRVANRFLAQDASPLPLARNLQAGSAAGASALLRNFAGQRTQRSVEEITQDMLEEDRSRNALLEQIIRNLKGEDIPA